MVIFHPDFFCSDIVSLVTTEGSAVVEVAMCAERENRDVPRKIIPCVKMFRSGANPFQQ